MEDILLPALLVVETVLAILFILLTSPSPKPKSYRPQGRDSKGRFEQN